MPTTIIGLFDSEQTAFHIRDQLESKGLGTESIDTVTWRRVSEGSDPWGIGAQDASERPTGRLAEELQSRGVPATDAQEFAEAVRRGGNLVITQVDDDKRADEIARMMDHEDSVDLGNRREKWRESGYQGFNPDADLYSQDEVERERHRTLEAGEEARLQEAHEEVNVGKRDVESGGIRVTKRVEERPVEKEVNLREEHASIERGEASGTTSGMNDEGLFEEESIELTEHAEEPVVEKKVKVDEEVRVGKEVTEHTETIHETARETYIDIEELSGGVSDEHAFSRYGDDYREHYMSNFNREGERYEDYEPAYRYGHTFGSSKNYSASSYDEAEPDIRQSYEKKHGSGSFDRFRDAARHAFSRSRNRTDGTNGTHRTT